MLDQALLVKLALDREGKKYNAKLHSRKMKEVEQFLVTHPTAKLLIVVSTHCIEETGFFVYGGSSKQRNLMSCHFGRVRGLHSSVE